MRLGSTVVGEYSASEGSTVVHKGQSLLGETSAASHDHRLSQAPLPVADKGNSLSQQRFVHFPDSDGLKTPVS